MFRTIILKNNSNEIKTYAGQIINVNEEYTIQQHELNKFINSNELFKDLAENHVQISDGESFFHNAISAWNWLTGNNIVISQKSDSHPNKVAVHSSGKPMISEHTFFAMWSGAGDGYDLDNDEWSGNIHDGDLLEFHLNPETESMKKYVFYNPTHGQVYIYDGLVRWINGGMGDYISSRILTLPTPLQQFVNLDLVLEYNDEHDREYIKFSPQGPGTGTHGFADAAKIHFLPRTFSLNGDWDIIDNQLIPNLEGTGAYALSSQTAPVHNFISKIPLFGDSGSILKLGSEESMRMRPGQFIEVEVVNTSGGSIEVGVFVQIFREKSFIP